MPVRLDSLWRAVLGDDSILLPPMDLDAKVPRDRNRLGQEQINAQDLRDSVLICTLVRPPPGWAL